MPRTPRYTRPAPPGCVWADEASRLTGLAIETLYKYRQRGIGPKSGTVGRKAVWKLVDIAAWLEDRMSPEADTDRERDSRPPEPHIPRRPAASRQRVRSGVESGNRPQPPVARPAIGASEPHPEP